MKKAINGYVICNCTAIAERDTENEAMRQDALLVINTAESGETFENIVFGWEMPKNEAEFNQMCEDSSAWEALTEEHRIVISK